MKKRDQTLLKYTKIFIILYTNSLFIESTSSFVLFYCPKTQKEFLFLAQTNYQWVFSLFTRLSLQ
jgi:hypothetical protein